MTNQLNKQNLEEYGKRRSRARLKKRVLTGLAAVVVFATTYALILPAFTMEAKSVCGLDEHLHSEACYEQQLTCELPAEGAHVHTPSCYSQEGELTCVLPATGHIHVPVCYSTVDELICENTDAAHQHSETCYLPAGSLICDEPETVHVHTAACYEQVPAEGAVAPEAGEAPAADGDAAAGEAAADEAAAEAADADETAEAADEVLGAVAALTADESAADVIETSEHAAAEALMTYQLVCTEQAAGHVHWEGCYNEAGEVVCGEQEQVTTTHEHTADCNDMVQTCEATEHAHDEVCFDAESWQMYQSNKKNKEELAAEEAGEADGANQDLAPVGDTELARLKAKGLAFENDNLVMVFNVPEDTEGTVRFDVAERDKPTMAGEEAEELGENDWSSRFLINATLDGEPVDDIKSLNATVQFQIKPEAIEPILEEIDLEEVAPEIEDEVGAEIIITQVQSTGKTRALSDVSTDEIEDVILTEADAAPIAMALVAPEVRASGEATPNPQFTVQYYAWMDRYVTTDSDTDSLPIIDTSAESNGGAAKLPVNSGNNKPTTAVRYLALDMTSLGTTDQNAGNATSLYGIKTNRELMKVYSTDVCEYIKRPNLLYINKLQENSHYTLNEVWVLKPGRSADSTNAADWDIYAAGTVHFTNKEETKNADPSKYILLHEGDVVRLVNDSSKSTSPLESPTSFYDYDLTDGKIYSSAEKAAAKSNGKNTSNQGNDTWYVNTNEQGINSPSNYGTAGAKLGFGNANTGSGLEREVFNGAYVNQYTRKDKSNPTGKLTSAQGYLGCSFGLVESLKPNGTIQYASGLSVPNLFNEGSAAGKSEYSGSLNFNRQGDTYTLTSATVAGAVGRTDLDKFFNPSPSGATTHSHIFTNNFWPMDAAASYGTNGHDLKFGDLGSKSARNAVGMTWSDSAKAYEAKTQAFPESDDGRDHNAYFGLHYQVGFDLTEDYCGPLEYYFFGDDDLWIFLDGKLVIDIGGVHSSVGEYADLWDHIEGGKGGHAETSHTLDIFYTERGESGSTCFMNFTLPSVSFAPDDQDTGFLKVEKKLEGNGFSDDEEFTFHINLKDAAGHPLGDDYSYERVNAKDESRNAADLVTSDGADFSLRGDEYIVIKYLPEGTHYEITETATYESNGTTRSYLPEIVVNGEAVTGDNASANKAAGVIDSNHQGSVVFTNSKYQLPETGGIGTQVFMLAGGMLVLFGLGVEWRRRRQQKTASIR